MHITTNWQLNPTPQSAIAQALADWQARHPGAKPIRLDRAEPVQPAGLACVAAMQAAVAQLGCKGTHVGSAPTGGHLFLREAVCAAYADYGVTLVPDEVLVTTGLRDGLSALLALLGSGHTALVADPCDPQHLVLEQQAGNRVVRMPANPANQFLPLPNEAGGKPDLIHLSSPGNPAGAVYSRAQLAQWVAYAQEVGALLLFDASYQAFVHSPNLPHSIYELEGAQTCAVELRTFCAADGLGGEPCGLLLVPHALTDEAGKPLAGLLAEAQAWRSEGASYAAQCGARAALSPAGRRQAEERVAEALFNARLLADGLSGLGLVVSASPDSPFVWVAYPNGVTDFAACLLEESGIVVAPGHLFGENGAGWMRLSGFAERAAIAIAIRRLEQQMHIHHAL